MAWTAQRSAPGPKLMLAAERGVSTAELLGVSTLCAAPPLQRASLLSMAALLYSKQKYKYRQLLLHIEEILMKKIGNTMSTCTGGN